MTIKARSLTIRLGLEEYEKLARIADSECRIPDQQVLFYVRRALAQIEMPTGSYSGDDEEPDGN